LPYTGIYNGLMVSGHISHLALQSAVTAAITAQNIGPVSMHPAPLHRSNTSLTQDDLVCGPHNAWL